MARRQPASIRHNNPGAQYPGPSARRFGSTQFAVIGGGHKIATFDNPIVGAAAQFDLLNRSYTGMTLEGATRKWTGGNHSASYARGVSRETGIALDAKITPELLAGPQGLALVAAMARREAGQAYPLTPEQWSQAQTLALGSREAFEALRTAQVQGAQQRAITPSPNVSDPAFASGQRAPSLGVVDPMNPEVEQRISPVSPPQELSGRTTPLQSQAPATDPTRQGAAAGMPQWAVEAFIRGPGAAVDPVQAISPVPPAPPRHEQFGAWSPGIRGTPVFKSLLQNMFGGF